MTASFATPDANITLHWRLRTLTIPPLMIHPEHVAQIGVLPKVLGPLLPRLLPVHYLLDCDHFLPEFLYSVEVSALPLGAFRFHRLFDSEPWVFLFFITVGTVLSSSSHIRVI